jgi:hypothetical protein
MKYEPTYEITYETEREFTAHFHVRKRFFLQERHMVTVLQRDIFH